jgi:serine/threonine-protein kinase 24/25/MST4
MKSFFEWFWRLIHRDKINNDMKNSDNKNCDVKNDDNKVTSRSDCYKLIDILGKGSEACVYKACDEFNNEYAIKIIYLNNDPDIMAVIQNEICIQNIVHHKNIILIKESFINNDNGTLWIVMEIAEHGSLKDILKNYYAFGIKDEIFLATIMKQLLIAIEFCHINKKIHRDIKSGNIMITKDGIIKLGDFGIATTFSNLKKHDTFVGTLFWLPPEIVWNKEYDEKIDIWSIGITALELAFGVPVYNNSNPTQIISKIMNNAPPSCNTYYEEKMHTTYIFSKTFENFLTKCLQKNPVCRDSAEELLKDKFIDKASDETYIKYKIDKAYKRKYNK